MEDFRAGTIAAVIVNAQAGGWGGEGEEKTPAEPSDFFPSLEGLRRDGPRDDSDALVRDLKGRGVVDTREG